MSQRDLWDKQHEARRDEHKEIALLPNNFAVRCAEFLQKNAKILELGAASGRDARFFAREKQCDVYAMDFSFPALKHLQEDSLTDESSPLVHPINADIKELPVNRESLLDAIYARSSLHLSDIELDKLLTEVCSLLKPGGFLMVEGKYAQDHAIKNSKKLNGNLALDRRGHLRRVWDEKYIKDHIVKKFGLKLMELNHTREKAGDKFSHFVNFIAKK